MTLSSFLGCNLGFWDRDQAPREFAHLLQWRRYGFLGGLGHAMNLRSRGAIVAAAVDGGVTAIGPNGCHRRGRGKHPLVSDLCFQCAPRAQAFQRRRNRTRHLALAPRPTIDGRRLHAPELGGTDLSHSQIPKGGLEYLSSHCDPRGGCLGGGERAVSDLPDHGSTVGRQSPRANGCRQYSPGGMLRPPIGGWNPGLKRIRIASPDQ